jgi:hypothetical protein
MHKYVLLNAGLFMAKILKNSYKWIDLLFLALDIILQLKKNVSKLKKIEKERYLTKTTWSLF